MIEGIFEVGMLLCFAASWPFNLTKAYRARTNIGTSILFMAVVWLGYIFGIINKLVNDDINYVLAFYLLDLLLVSIGIAIYMRNSVLDRESGALGRMRLDHRLKR